jgi:hypothetical protein
LQFRLDENLTKPPECKFIVKDIKDYTDSMYSVTLRDPANRRRRRVKRRLDTEEANECFFGKKRKLDNFFLNPVKMDGSVLKNITGLSRGNFGVYCRKLAKVGIKVDNAHRHLSLPSMAMLERSKCRQGLSNRVLQGMFNVSYGVVFNTFWDVQIKVSS